MNAQQLIDLLHANKAKSLDELDGNVTKEILESINAFSVSESEGFRDIAEAIAPSEYDDPHPIAVFFIRFLKNHVHPESCIELFKKLIGTKSVGLFALAEKRRLVEEFKSLEFDELQFEMEPDKFRQSVERCIEDSAASIRGAQEPPQTGVDGGSSRFVDF